MTAGNEKISNILGRFPLNVKKTLITEVASTLLMTSDLTLLSSMAHMRWAMEVLGQGFTLPLEELAIAQETTHLYSQWLFEPPLRPLAFKQAAGTVDEQLIYQARPIHNNAAQQQRATPTSAPPMGSSNISINSNLNSHLHLLHHQGQNSPTNVPVNVLIQRHVELCKKVLTVLTMAGRQLGSSFSEETWDVLLKVTLGITDCLLREQSDKSSPAVQEYARMSDDLCEHLLRVLFELWLRSGTQKVEMWDILKRCFACWTHRAPVIHQWAATSLGLSQRVVRLLYGPKQGSENVNLAVGGYNVTLDLRAEFVYYAWHRVTYLLMNPARLPPGNCLIAVNGIGRLVETFLSVGRNVAVDDYHDHRPVTPPDGNTLMHMYGSWLFDISAISSSPSTHHIIAPYAVHETYHEAQASAFGVLCRIFSRPQPTDRPFLRIYTERFYDALSKGLRNETCLPTILAHSAELFTSDLAGVRMMVPDFVVGIRMAMSGRVRVLGSYKSPEKQKQTLEDLYLAALKVVGCIICLPNYFDKVELKEGWSLGLLRSAGMSMDAISPREDKEILAQLIRVLYTDEDSSTDPSKPKRFTTLKYYILEMLLNCLETETSPYNLRYLLHLIEVYVYEDVAFCPGLVGVVVKTIQEKIVPIQVPVEVALCAFDVLMGCSRLYEHVKRDSKSCARELVLALCRYVDALLANHAALKTKYPLIVRAYECIIQWILAGQWIVDDQDCQMAVISSLSSGIHIVERVEEFETAHVAPKPTQEKRRWGGGTSGASAMISAVGAPLAIGRPNSSSNSSKLFQNSKAPGPIKILQQKEKDDNTNKRSRAASSSVVPNIGLTVKPQQRSDLLAIQHAAELAMTQFSLQLSNFPIWINDLGPARVSTLWDDIRLNRVKLKEVELAKDYGDYNPYPYNPQAHTVGPVRYFLVDKKIILGCTEPIPSTLATFAMNGVSRRTSRASTIDPRLNGIDGAFMDDNDANEGPSVIVTMRDTNGKNSWKIQMRYLDKSMDQLRSISKEGSRRDCSSSSEATGDSSNTSSNTKTPPMSSTSNSSVSSACKKPATIPELKIPKPRVLYVEAAEEASIGLSRIESSSDAEGEDVDNGLPLSQRTLRQNGGRRENSSDDISVMTTTAAATHQRSATGTESSTSSQGLATFSEGEAVENDHSLTTTSSVTGAEIFRILLAQMGYLSVENRHRIIPLHLTDSLLNELEKLDNLKERETISISVYYAHSGDVSYSELVHGSPMGLPKDFTRFLDCLGWPILVESHPGYLGGLTKNNCRTAPYYADRTCEVIFHVPYLVHLDPEKQEQIHQRASSRFSSAGSTPVPSSPSSMDGNTSHLFIPEIDAETQRHQFEEQFRQMVAFDHVAVVWIEDREQMMQLPALIGQQTMVYLMIHPLKGTSTGGLFWIRIVIHGSTAAAVRLSQNPLMIGPLVDGMLVSRHGLGSLIRNTAISAERACRIASDSFSHPTAVRTKFIEEFAQKLKHQGPETISDHSTDFEVHRNWLAITYSLPISKWYLEDTSEWTLDYPPFFAWFEKLLSFFGAMVDPAMVKVDNLEYASTATIYFQRTSVIVSELVLFWELQRMLAVMGNRPLQKLINWSLFLNPGLLMVDNMHFQYNGFLYGILIHSLVDAKLGKLLRSGVLFAVLLNFKHIFLYIAPSYFVFLLRAYCFENSENSIRARSWLSAFRPTHLIVLGLSVIAVFALSLGPFVAMHQIPQLVARLFPFKRGLTHSYWAANLWALYSFADRVMIIIASKTPLGKFWNLSVDPSALSATTRGLVGDTAFGVLPTVTAQHTLLVTLLLMLPSLVSLFRRPTFDRFIGSLVLSAFASFLAGWHVHEKAILLVTVAMSVALANKVGTSPNSGAGALAKESGSLMLTQRDVRAFLIVSLAGYVGLWPLFFTRPETPIKVGITLAWFVLVAAGLDQCTPKQKQHQHQQPTQGGVRLSSSRSVLRQLNVVERLYVVGFIPVQTYVLLVHGWIFGEEKMAFLPLMITSVYCAMGVVYGWLLYSYAFATTSSLADKKNKSKKKTR
ncbi:glycosyl transferase [Actinomortierella wolfii]|nr:glycosyl transferase [Actinomortierella wolfii]